MGGILVGVGILIAYFHRWNKRITQKIKEIDNQLKRQNDSN